MSKPIAILISDIHFNLNTLPIATKALQAAINKAEEVKVPLIIAGDLHDTKPIIRAEVANTLIELFKNAKAKVYILVGNHDLINEKGQEHGLNYLRPYVNIVDDTTFLDHSELWMIPYQNDPMSLAELLTTIPPGSMVIMHQGFKGAWMGDYVQDKTSIDISTVKDFRVYSGHYHRHQTLGTVTYIGSPFTMSFGEANDGGKGFLILNEDGTFTREILGLRAHVILEFTLNDQGNIKEFIPKLNPDDLLWLKVKGQASQLKQLDKKALGEKILGHSNYKLDLIPLDSKKTEVPSKNVTNEELFDTIIDDVSDTDEHKTYLKQLWRDLL